MLSTNVKILKKTIELYEKQAKKPRLVPFFIPTHPGTLGSNRIKKIKNTLTLIEDQSYIKNTHSTELKDLTANTPDNKKCLTSALICAIDKLPQGSKTKEVLVCAYHEISTDKTEETDKEEHLDYKKYIETISANITNPDHVITAVYEKLLDNTSSAIDIKEIIRPSTQQPTEDSKLNLMNGLCGVFGS